MSDPSAILLPVHQALTSDMMLGLKPSAPKSRSYRISVAPLNGSIFALLHQVKLFGNYQPADVEHGLIKVKAILNFQYNV